MRLLAVWSFHTYSSPYEAHPSLSEGEVLLKPRQSPRRCVYPASPPKGRSCSLSVDIPSFLLPMLPLHRHLLVQVTLHRQDRKRLRDLQLGCLQPYRQHCWQEVGKEESLTLSGMKPRHTVHSRFFFTPLLYSPFHGSCCESHISDL